eukprot:COSAG06_NODE_7247_length_2571_cov_28.150936_3_plen_103_part_00
MQQLLLQTAAQPLRGMLAVVAEVAAAVGLQTVRGWQGLRCHAARRYISSRRKGRNFTAVGVSPRWVRESPRIKPKRRAAMEQEVVEAVVVVRWLAVLLRHGE